MGMKVIHLLAVSAAMSALLIFAAAKVDAQQRAGGVSRNMFTGHHGGGMHGRKFHGGFPGVWVVEREVVVERETPPPPAAVPLPEQAQGGTKAPPRKPYVIGSTYASLPSQGCMKLIEDGASYYYCGGEEWYKQTGKQYRAVARKL